MNAALAFSRRACGMVAQTDDECHRNPQRRHTTRTVTDTTELLAGSGRLYLAAVLDLYSRLIVRWSISAVNDRLRKRGLPQGPLRSPHHVQHESARQLSRQRQRPAVLAIPLDDIPMIGISSRPGWPPPRRRRAAA